MNAEEILIRSATDRDWNAERLELLGHGLKLCDYCKHIRPTSHFSINKMNLDGMMGMCRRCETKKGKGSHANN